MTVQKGQRFSSQARITSNLLIARQKILSGGLRFFILLFQFLFLNFLEMDVMKLSNRELTSELTWWGADSPVKLLIHYNHRSTAPKVPLLCTPTRSSWLRPKRESKLTRKWMDHKNQVST
jgi:hypothetical protein